MATDTRTVTAMATQMVTPMAKATAIQMATQMVEGLRAEEDELLKDAQSILEDSHIKLRSHIPTHFTSTTTQTGVSDVAQWEDL